MLDGMGIRSRIDRLLGRDPPEINSEASYRIAEEQERETNRVTAPLTDAERRTILGTDDKPP